MLSGNEHATRALDYPTPSLSERPHDIRIKELEKQVKTLLVLVSNMKNDLGYLQEEVDGLKDPVL